MTSCNGKVTESGCMCFRWLERGVWIINRRLSERSCAVFRKFVDEAGALACFDIINLFQYHPFRSSFSLAYQSILCVLSFSLSSSFLFAIYNNFELFSHVWRTRILCCVQQRHLGRSKMLLPDTSSKTLHVSESSWDMSHLWGRIWCTQDFWWPESGGCQVVGQLLNFFQYYYEDIKMNLGQIVNSAYLLHDTPEPLEGLGVVQRWAKQRGTISVQSISWGWGPKVREIWGFPCFAV